ncbi:MAG TPA: DUF2142 domain-containing protein [Propionicimonas sp.]
MGSVPSPRRTWTVWGWVALGLALAVLQGIWSVAMPPMASPDEPSHVIHAAAVARGQWSGDLGPAPTTTASEGRATTVRLPSDYLAVSRLQDCFAHYPDQPASCQRTVPAPDGTTADVTTYAGQYPPLYYLLVGWPSRFLPAVPSMYAMRLVSAVIAAALLVWGLYRLRTVTRPAGWMWAAIAAITPMTLFIGAMVNPQALEIPAAFAFWAACLALVRSPDEPSRGTVVQAAVAGALLVNARTSGPFWALTIVVVALVVAPPGRLRTLWGLRPIRWALGVAVAAGLAVGAWVLTHGAVVGGAVLFPRYSSPLRVVALMLADSYGFLMQMIGNFGWLDAPSPPLTVMVWTVVVGTLLAIVIAISGRRLRAGLLLGLLAVVAMPVALQIPTAANTGIIWQGRYSLPVAVGVPMVAAVALTAIGGPYDEMARRIVRWGVVPAAAVAHVAAFLWAMRRYSVGLFGQLITRSPDWSSPLGYLTAVAIYAVPVAALALVAWLSLRPMTGIAPISVADERAPQPAV